MAGRLASEEQGSSRGPEQREGGRDRSDEEEVHGLVDLTVSDEEEKSVTP